MITLAVLCLILAAAAAGCLAHDWFADKWATYAAGSPELSAPEALRNVPEPTWDQPADVVRARLRSVPVPPSLSLVPDPPADDDWVFAADLFVPEQRRPGSAS